jgi:uncharacterized protein YcfJ
LAASPLSAQTAPSAQAENVRVDYAQVLNVEPVYASPSEQHSEKLCDDVPKPDGKPGQAQPGHLARMWASVKGWFSDDETKTEIAGQQSAQSTPHCHDVLAQQDTRKAIAYDVDYVYRGMKYRARLPEDPGNRLKIRISVMPYLPNGNDATP